MNTMRALKKVVLGETWTLPLGLALTLTLAALIRSVAGGAWSHAGGLFMLAAVMLTLHAAIAGTLRH